jgi:acetyl/propionyl-CoA carboxylase alpha subunit/acetyl-CoA carboxylase carboxyltransferase component
VLKKLLVANRGEIAIRIARTAAEMSLPTVSVFSEDDAQSLHAKGCDETFPLKGQGPAAYLDIAQIVAAAKACGCDGVHPGYGFLAENARLAQACAEAKLVFVGPDAETLELFGDKVAARALAAKWGVPLLRATGAPLELDEARSFLETVGAKAGIMLKAVAGGGGRGMRAVTSPATLRDAFERCRSEATSFFGNGDLYAEEFLERARHVEVQVVGDGTGAVSHLWDRECSLQRQRQKIVEIAPASTIALKTRKQLWEAAVTLGGAARLRGLATVEFLVVEDRFVFIETNPRLQVEHTVTEEVTGLDLVRIQLDIAGGRMLEDLNLLQSAIPEPRGTALEARINLETMTENGVKPSGGQILAYDLPSGPGVRVDGYGFAGYRTNPRFDSLLAKLVVHSQGDLASAMAKAIRSLRAFEISGVSTNIPFLIALLREPGVASGDFHTRTIESEIATLLAAIEAPPAATAAGQRAERAGAKIDAIDPLAVLAHGKSGRAASPQAPPSDDDAGLPGTLAVRAPLQGTIVSIAVNPGDAVRDGEDILVIESMKMEHVIPATASGFVREITVAPGDTIFEGHILVSIEEADIGRAIRSESAAADLDEIRPDLAAVLARHAFTGDEARPEAIARRRDTKQRTARENIDALCDEGSFTEYGALVVAARRARNTEDELVRRTPADGLVMGLGSVNGALFDEERARCAVMSYDYTVLAGTQGAYNHLKMDRMYELALRWRLPTVFFTEGGGGRPGDTESGGPIRGFELGAKLSGAAPFVGVTSGRCFAGNAAVLGCCDVIIAARDSTIGMGGPAMVEGGGLGVFRPEEIGPLDVQEKNGTIDITVADEDEGVRVARKYLSYFQGPLKTSDCADQRLLRRIVPENRLRVYDMRALIATLADTDSMLELRPKFGRAMITALVRIEGRPMGLIANNPQHLGGAIDSDASDKASRFMQLCEAFDLPLLSLSDTPGNMVGPEAEKTALVRHCSRMFLIGANLTIPIFSVIIRKSYGLGAIAMFGGSREMTTFYVSWPTGEFGGMGLEGSVKLGFRNELAAIADPAARKQRFDEMVRRAYERGKAINVAMRPGLDDVIDPADTRRWILAGLKAIPTPPPRQSKKIPWIDAW